MANTKRYVITAITLGIIGAASAAIIGVTNLVTREQIKQNEQNKINEGIAEIFGQNSTILNTQSIENEKYTNTVYFVKADEKNQYAFRADGSNMYGKISLLVGFNELNQFKGISVIVNEQTYASTLVNKYIDPMKKADNKDKALEDVSCGATYGAKLIRDLVNDARSVVNKINAKE